MSKIEKLDKIAKKLGDWMDVVIYVLGCAGLLFAVVLCGANILSWWFFGRRLGLTDELALIGLVWASYVGMGLLYRDRRSIFVWRRRKSPALPMFTPPAATAGDGCPIW